MRNGLFLGIGTVTALVTLSGCGSGGGSTSNGAVAFGPLAGTWRATALTGGGDDIPCPATVAGSGTTTSGSIPAQFGCGTSDTFTFRSDSTFTVTTASTTSTSAPVSTTPATYTGRWSQFQTRVLLTLDGTNSASFPYGTSIDFRNTNQILVPVVGFPTLNRYIFTRQ